MTTPAVTPDQRAALLARAHDGRLTPAEQHLLARVLENAQAALLAATKALVVNPHRVACDYCGAEPGQPCTAVNPILAGQTVSAHTVRSYAARQTTR